MYLDLPMIQHSFGKGAIESDDLPFLSQVVLLHSLVYWRVYIEMQIWVWHGVAQKSCIIVVIVLIHSQCSSHHVLPQISTEIFLRSPILGYRTYKTRSDEETQ